MKPRAYLEVAALFEPHWTGIPMVTAGLAEKAIDDDEIDWTFFNHSIALPRELITTLLHQRSGAGANEFLADHLWSKSDIPYRDAHDAKAVFTNIKPVRNFFGDEAMVVHDLSPLLTPQFHAAPTVSHFSNRIRADVATTSKFFCNSSATQDDLITYFRVGSDDTEIIRMGASIDLADVTAARQAASSFHIEPYVVVLGTLEPRKNGTIILKFIARNPDFANRFRIVFVGRAGWMDENARLLKEIEEAGLSPDRVVFTGYLNDTAKTILLYNAAFCIYPSFFEGFGLPILEASVLGKLVVCSDTSSMPEVAPENSVFFDPTDLLQFTHAIRSAEARLDRYRQGSTLAQIAARLETFSWDRCYAQVADWIRS